MSSQHLVDIEEAEKIGRLPASRIQSEPAPSRFRLTRFDAVLMTTADYLVKGILPCRGFIVVWGPPKCGKSFFTFDLAMHIARSAEYRGWRVRGGPVIYVALEGGHGFRNRIEAYRRTHGPTSAPFFLITDRTNLIRDSGAMIAAIREQIGLNTPVLVVIDTLNRSLVGSESEDRDMGAYVRAADEIREALQCAVLIVHHCGVEGTRPRGHTSLTGAADAQIAISRNTAGIITAKVEFMKDGPEGCTILSRLDSVELGQDDDGEPVSSCVIVPVEGDAVSESKPAKLPNSAQIALRALAEAIDEQGVVPPASRHIPAGVKTVRVQAWRQQAYLRGISTGEQRAREQAFKRGSDQLIKINRVGFWDEQVWLV